MSGKERKELERKIEAVLIAIPREIDAREYYLELEKQYEDESSKEMFSFLAKQEEQHRIALERILSELEKKLENLPR